jgi:hypothetical protein
MIGKTLLSEVYRGDLATDREKGRRVSRYQIILLERVKVAPGSCVEQKFERGMIEPD